MKKVYILISFVFLITSLGFTKPVSKEILESNVKIYKQNRSMIQLMNQKINPDQKLKSIETKTKMLEEITFPDGSKKELTYNDQGQTIGYKYYKFDEAANTVVLSSDNTFSYDNKGNRILQVYNTLMDKGMTNTEKDEFEYDVQNRETVHIFSEYSFDYSKLIKSSKTITSYQSNGYKSEEYGWDEATQTWNLESKSEIELKDNYLFKGSFYAKSEDIGEIILSLSQEYFYDAKGNMIQTLAKAYDKESGKMVDFMKSVMTYDSHGNETMSVDSMFYAEMGSWMAWSKNISIFNSNNVLTSDEYYSLDWLSFQLAIFEKHEYSYTNNKLSQELVWEKLEVTGELSQSYKFEFAYDNSINIEDVILPNSLIEHNEYSDIWGYFQFSFGALSNVKWYKWDEETKALKQYHDATYHYSNTSGEVAVNNMNLSTLKIGPNPFNESITISLSGNEDAHVTVYNFAGQQIFKSSVNNMKEINTSDWKPGIYLIHANFGNDQNKITKLVKR
jgi:hypothetical protein